MRIKDEELFFVDYEKEPDKSLLYVPLRDYLALVPNTTKQAILRVGRNVIKTTILNKLESRPKINIHRIHKLVQNNPKQLTLAITDNCNLRCRYCHHSAGDTGKTNSMPVEMIDSLLENYFAQNIPSKKAIIDFAGGGEPTCQFDILSHAVKKAKELGKNKGIKVFFQMATNGCFNKQICAFLARNFTHLSLSLDGPAFIQDFHRPFKDGNGSFTECFKTARYLEKRKRSFGFRATISNYSLPYLPKIIDFFTDNFPGKTVGLEPLSPFGRGRENELTPPNKTHFAEAIIQAYKYSEGRDIVLSNAGIGKFDALRTVFCGGVGIPTATINTDGSVSCCTRDNAPEVFKYGVFDCRKKKYVIEKTKLQKIRKMNVFNYIECQDCFCKYHCAGDCPDLRLANLTNCVANRMLGSYWLHKRIAKSIVGRERYAKTSK